MQPSDQAPAEITEGETPEAGMAGDAPTADDTVSEPAPVEGMAIESAAGEISASASAAVVPRQGSAEMLGDWLLSNENCLVHLLRKNSAFREKFNHRLE